MTSTRGLSDKEKALVEKQARYNQIQRAARERELLDRETPEIRVTPANEVPDERLQSLFGGRFIRGAFQLLVGPGEAGKGMCSTDLVARFSTGMPFPGDDQTKWRSPMPVVVCVTEDSESRVKARLMAAEANLKKVLFVKGPPANRGGIVVPSPIALDDDAGALLKLVQQYGAGAIFLETMLEHLGDREGKKQWSTNNEAEVRRALAPMVALCREGNLIGWGVMHPRKSSDGGISDSISGSAAFNNVGRTVLHVYRDPTDDNLKNPGRLLFTSKSNYMAKRPATLKFRIDSWDKDPNEGRVVWGIAGRTLEDDRHAEDIWRQLRELNVKRRDYAVRDAEKLLLKILTEGQKTMEEVKEAAVEEGISWRAIERAKEVLKVESVKTGFPAKVVGWRLPEEDV